MRPLVLKLSAFGPYAGQIEIPMEELGNRGIYLITGDTGAGKTTIFDAISFVLYGEASGPNRDASMFRSKYAGPDTPTRVEMTFLHGGKEYFIRRSPEYLRPKKSGEGFTKQAADAELHMPDGRIFTKVKDVTSVIEELLGINRDQFSQIAMLAQGDFLKLLLADTKQRQEIFRELFKTQYYQTLQYRLEDKRKEVYAQVEDGKKSIRQYIWGIKTDKDDVLALDVEKAKQGSMTAEDVIELLGKLTDQDSELKDKLDCELKQINDELEAVNKRIGAAQELEKARKALENAKIKLAEEEPVFIKLTGECKLAGDALKEKTNIEKQANLIETELPDYDAADKIKTETERLKKENADRIKKLMMCEEEQKADTDRLGRLKNEHDSFKDAGAEIEKKKASIERINEEIAKLHELAQYFNGYNDNKSSYVKAQKDYLKKDEIFKKANLLYETKEQAFRDGQAGILAAKLKEGEKCPVCGSVSHPFPAHVSEDVPSEEELKITKKESDDTRKKRDEAAERISGLKSVIETQKTELRNKTAKLVNTEDLDEAWENLEDVVSKCRKKLEIEEGEYKEEELKIKRKKELDSLIPDLENNIEKARSGIEKMRSDISAEEAKIREKELYLAELKKGLRFEDKSEAEKKHNELLKQAKEIQDVYDKANEALAKQNERILELKTSVKENEKTIGSAEDISIDTERSKQEALNKRQADCIERNRIVTGRLKSNTETRINIIAGASGITETEKKLQWIKALSDTANGKLSGKDKIMLETYIQTTYFDRIINRANLRLITMSGGQYELIRMTEAANKQEKSGLDLGVTDHYNGTKRSVKTLSGGDSFMASLSLALGLSDEVQSSAGGIQIDTMFVDEGFGSLDPEALDMAYKALAGLTEGNRLVGIISHVADLKDRIDRQIVVTKDKSGGSRIKMVV